MKNLINWYKKLMDSDVRKIHFVSLISGMLFYTPIMTLFLLQRNIDVAFLVVAQTAFSIGMILSEMPTGVLADKYGQLNSIRAGLFLDALGMLQLLFVHNKIALLAYFVVRGVSVALRSGSDEALLYESYIQENKTAVGYSKSYGKLLTDEIIGFITASIVAGLAVQVFGASAYKPLIIATGLIVLLSLVFTFTIKNGKKAKQKLEEFNSISHLKQSFSLVKENRTIFALLIAGLLTLNGEYFLRQSYQPFFQDMKVPAVFLGLALAIGKLLNYGVIRFSHRLEKLLTVDQIVFWVNILTGILFGVLAFARTPWVIVPVFILLQGLFNAERPVVSDYINQQIESHQRSTVLSAVSFALNVGQILARIGLGISIGALGIGSSFMVQGFYLIIGTVIGVWYLRKCGCVHKVQSTNTPVEVSVII